MNKIYLIFFVIFSMISTNIYGEQVIRMEEMVIKGRVQKPQAMYILQRSTHVTFKTSIENKREDFRLNIANGTKLELFRYESNKSK